MEANISFCKPSIDKKEVSEVRKVLRSGWLTMGKKVVEFEKSFAIYTGVNHAIAVNSCTSALHLALVVLDLKSGDEVITTPLSFASTINAILYVGAKPVLVDVDDTQCIDVTKIREKITSKTKVLLPVHFGGTPCNMTEIMKIAQEFNLKVVEDCAHSVGGTYDGQIRMGGLGNLSCFSFYPTKNMTTGEGGMITTNDDLLADRLRELRLHGMSKDAWKRYEVNDWQYDVKVVGFKYNMTDVNAVLGLVQLGRLKVFVDRRREIAGYYDLLLKSLPLVLPKSVVGKVWHIYPIQTDNRELLVEHLKSNGVGFSVFFIPIHFLTAYKFLGYKKGDFPVCERFFERTVSLPLYPSLTNEQVELVGRVLFDFFR